MDTTGLTESELIDAHRKMKRRLGWLRILLPVVLILLFGMNIYAIARQVQNVDSEKVASELEGEFHKLWPRIEDELATVATNMQPVLQKALAEESAKLAPRLDKRLESDIESLKVQVEKDFETELVRALEEIERRQRQVLIDHIPELKHDRKAQDRVLEQVRISVLKWCMKQLTSTLHEHLVVMEKIRATLQRNYMANPGAKADAEETLSIWLELMNEHVGGDENILGPAPGEKPKKKKKSAVRKSSAK